MNTHIAVNKEVSGNNKYNYKYNNLKKQKNYQAFLDPPFELQ